MPSNHHQQFWLGLHLVPNFGIAKLSRLLKSFSSAEELWREADSSIMRLDLPRKLLDDFCAARRKIDVTREMDRVASAGASLITLEDESYPRLLRSLPDRPILLYFRGALALGNESAVAVVGTRKASRYGLDVAFELSRQLARQGVTIISGMAHGIDAEAHRGALDAGGKTIAVVATGIDRVYPREHIELAADIEASGAIITEMPLRSAPLGKNFPQRNRIISGLSLGVLVAEAPIKSGALNTVAHAIDQGRDVFAVPHNIYSLPGRGGNILIQEGAKLVASVEDILDELQVTQLDVETRSRAQEIQPANETENAILQQLSADPVHVDFIVRQTDLPTATVTSTLTMLELKGLAENAGPMQYCRAR